MTKTRDVPMLDARVIRDKANHMLAVTPDTYHAQREAIFTLAEALLMEAGAYKGFRFTDQSINQDKTRRQFL